MKQRNFQKKVYKLSGWIEIFISVILVVAVMIFALGLIKNLYSIIIVGRDRMSSFNDFLGNAFQIVIGIEFIKMLCKHTPNTVVEVLMFAMARQMVVEHTSPAENLLCVLGITVLFLIRRFLFTESDKANHYQEQISEQKEFAARQEEARAGQSFDSPELVSGMDLAKNQTEAAVADEPELSNEQDLLKAMEQLAAEQVQK